MTRKLMYFCSTWKSSCTSLLIGLCFIGSWRMHPFTHSHTHTTSSWLIVIIIGTGQNRSTQISLSLCPFWTHPNHSSWQRGDTSITPYNPTESAIVSLLIHTNKYNKDLILKRYSALAYAAQTCGNYAKSKVYIAQARLLSGNMYDAMEPDAGMHTQEK